MNAVDQIIQDLTLALTSSAYLRALPDEQKTMQSLVVGADVGYGFLYFGKGGYGKYQVLNHGFSKIVKIQPSGRFLLENGLTFDQQGSRLIGQHRVWLMRPEDLTAMLNNEPIIQRRLSLTQQIRKIVNTDGFPYELTASKKNELLALVNTL
jgi:hypothetical protein